jgi:MinD-like ATPase involved in chromosome partitioning or flagellar assembly
MSTDTTAPVDTPSEEDTSTSYIQGADYVPRNSIRGVWYLVKCWLANVLPWSWEPKAPHDKQYRIFMDLAEQLSVLMMDRKRMISVLGSKGGIGKTPLGTFLAALIALVSRRRTLIVDANHNEGTTGPALDISRDGRVLLLAAIKNPSLLDSSDQLRDGLGFHKESGLLALLSNPNSITENVTMKQSTTLLFFLFKRFDAVVNDGGNGIAHPIINGSASVGDVLLFPALATKPSSFRTAMTTMLGFYDLGHKDKVRNGLKVVSATGRKRTRKEFVDHYRQLIEKFASYEMDPRGDDDEKRVRNPWFNKSEELMAALGICEENIFLVPESKHIRLERVVTLKREYVGMPALIAYMRILVRVFQMSVPSEEQKRVVIKQFLNTSQTEGGDAGTLTEAEETAQTRARLIELEGSPEMAAVNLIAAS